MNTWLTTRQAVEYIKRCADTIRIAAQMGELHGHQSGRKGRWTFKPECLDAWLENMNQPAAVRGRASAAACGCQHLRLARRAS